ncbi:DUF389 domain-containing protein [Flavicella sediminum]|uniref:DUF389 domain-containing protein n=1 Tax=Flavicella sediminum TaxID=2585141 RepID=UPI00112476BB|nr:DUF389 domain-containing protein [Flavicella sediminum]
MENPQDENLIQQKEGIKKDFSDFLQGIRKFLIQLLDIREGTNKAETIQQIKDGITVKSHTAWILIFSILIASIGLNTSSTAVVIGAMLISPLMGPILGVGLSIGINDIDTLKRSLVNLGVMVGLSLLSSFIFFSIPLFQEATPELLARTQPDVRDVLIAIAGGLALIISVSRHKVMTNTIAGIAIATALMPPLCTAGYGLATWNLKFFGGAMFLFTINAIFIALATFVVVKSLRFPMVRYIDSVKRKRIAQMASLVAIVILGFSIYLFYGLFQKNKFDQNAQEFITVLKEKTGAGIINTEIDYPKRTIKLVVLGKNIQQDELAIWTEKLPTFDLFNTRLEIQQDNETSKLLDEINTIKSSYVKNQELIATKEETINEKDKTIRTLLNDLERIQKKQIPFIQVSQEAKINYEELKNISFSNVLSTDFTRIDTIPVFQIQWKDSIDNTDLKEQQLKRWLQTRLQLDSLQLIRK